MRKGTLKNLYLKLRNTFKKAFPPRSNTLEANPLSPCEIKPYEINDKNEKEENKAYEPVSLLMKAIDDERILNIAVAGNYGVGKSSIIITAEKNIKRKHRFIKISLASLLVQENSETNRNRQLSEGQEDSENPEDLRGTIKGSVSDAQIEYSILQQILYHDKPQKMPKSRIKRIHRTSFWKPIKIALFCLLLFFAYVFFIQPEWAHIGRYINLEDTKSWVNLLIKWGPIAVFVSALWIICNYVARHYSFSLSSLGYKDVEMKIKDKMSIFNAYLDEIVYFFESTKYDVVVFEDLDRFSNKEVIFYKLRELNTILNNCGSLNRKINFVYSVLDHLFDSEERVKFFDYIITVIPVINSLNSYNKLKENIKPTEMFEKLGRNELLNLCDYFQDMRLLLNIVNEFNQFIILLDTEVMTEKVLFGLVVYKNYFPPDFSLMYNKAGTVAGILDHADESKDAIIQSINLKISDLKEQLKTIGNDKEKKLFDLRIKCLEKGKALSSYSNLDLQMEIDDDLYLFDAVAEDALLFERFKSGRASFWANGRSFTIPDFSTIEKNFGGIGSFEKASTGIKKDYELKVDEIERRIESLNNELLEIPTSVAGIYRKDSSFLNGELEKISDIGKRNLVRFLILNDYLDRDYQYYISYFYPNSLKREDRNFVMRAGRMDGLQYNAELKAVEEILMRFDAKDFESNISLLNIDILRVVFQDKKKYNEYKSAICHLIAQSKSFDFLQLAYAASPTISQSFFFQFLRTYDFWNEIENFQGEEADTLREIYLRFCILRKDQLNSSFTAWLDKNYSFIETRWESISAKRVIEIFKAIEPCFNQISLKDIPGEVFQDILEHQRYEFTKKNICEIVKKIGFYDKYKVAAYTSIKETNITPLIQTINSNLAIALKSVFPSSSVYENDSSKCMIVDLALTHNAKNEARAYLSKQRSPIRYIRAFSDNCLDFVFDHSLAAPTWDNIYYYTVTKGKGVPVNFIQKNHLVDKVNTSVGVEEEAKLRRLLAFSDMLKVPKYKEIIPLFSLPFEVIENHIQPVRMLFLIENNYLKFTKDNYARVRSEYGFSKQFILSNLYDFLNSPKDYEFGKDEVIAILDALPSKKAKCDFLRSIKDIEIYPDAKLTSIVSPWIENGDIKVTDINIKLLLAVIDMAEESVRMLIGKRAILSLPYSGELVSDILKSMNGEYKRFLTSTAVSSLTYSRDAILVCNYLTTNGYVERCERKGDKIIVFKKH